MNVTTHCLILASSLLLAGLAPGADVNIVIPGGTADTFTTNIHFNVAAIGDHRTVRVTPGNCYYFSVLPDGSAMDTDVTIEPTMGPTRCEAEFKVTLVSGVEGWARIKGSIAPGNQCGCSGTSGGSGTATGRDFVIGVTNRLATIQFTEPVNGTNLTCCAGTTNNLETTVVLGDGATPSAGTVTFSATPSNLGSFHPSASVALAAGVAATQFIATTNGGSGTITATTTGLLDEDGHTVPNVATNISVSVVKVRVKWSSTDITGSMTNVIVGQQINLSAVVDPSGLTPTSYQWTIPGTRIANYSADATAGTVTHLTATNLTQSSVGFYWIDGADNREVECVVSFNGVACKGKATFNVKRPTASVAATTGAVGVGTLTNQAAVWLHFGDKAAIPGISLSQENTIPPGFSGDWEWVQVVQASVLRAKDAVTGKWRKKEGSGLDTTYPYNQSPVLAEDSPRLELRSSKVEETADESFSIWLMFKPSTPNSIWVPVRKVNWYWKGNAVQSSGSWSLTSSTHATNPSDADSTDHPTWTGNIANSIWVDEP